jgi:hypothetical protein
VKFPLKHPMLVSTRIEGQNGRVRELSAVLDFNAPYCVVLAPDAIDLGYSEAANKHVDFTKSHPDRVPWFTSMRGIDRGLVVTLRKVSLGSLTVNEVDAVILELEHPRFITFEMILGRTFLKNFKLTVDMKKGKKGYLSLLPSR